MSNSILAGKRGIIFGALDSNSIAWNVAEHAHAEGAKFTLTNAPVALRMGTMKELSEKCGAEVIPADVTLTEDMEQLFTKSMEVLGGKLDFVLHSVGMSLNVRKGRDYTDTNYDFYHKTMDISAISLHRMLQTAMKLDALNEKASVVTLTYIAGQRVFPDYNDMADAKAMLESITRSFGYHYGVKNKVRINAVSQSPTKTTAGSGVKGFGDFFGYADKMSPLGNASAKDCAKFCCALFSDYTQMVTMQTLYHDGGFSAMGVSPAVL